MGPINEADKAAIRQDVEPIVAPLTLNQAMARALKYNLDRRAKMMEEALALNQLDVTKFDMLPKLVAQAGYASRNNESNSMTSVAGGPLTGEDSVNKDRTRSTRELGFTWNLLDLGLGYYNSHQQADRVLIATERRRKAMHVLMQDVRTAYWRAVSAQKLRADVDATIAMGEDALNDSRRVEAERVRNPLDALRYQRQLLENMRLLEAIDQELASASLELSSLINAPVGQTVVLADVDVKPDDTELLGVPLKVMEEAALAQNADLREHHYNARLARDEVRKTLVKLYPNVSLSYGIKYDSDKYLINNNWNELGLQVSFNLFNLMTGPTQIKLAEAGVALANQRRLAMHVAVITQVHLARLQLINARNQFDRADEIYTTDLKISGIVKDRATAAAQSKLDAVANGTAAILSLLRRYQAMAQVQSAENKLLASLGVEPRIGSTSEMSLEQLTEQIKLSGGLWSELLNPKPVPLTATSEMPAAASTEPAAAANPPARPPAEAP
ncbi:MAG: TolC family protein, partial [Rhodoferax sp.]|nr:TolC family protein [Rhodoferax sp.]